MKSSKNKVAKKTATKKASKKVAAKKTPAKKIVPTATAKGEHKIKKTKMSWKNPVTGAIVGYQRALRLGLTKMADAVSGILNPKTGHLVEYQRAHKLGLV